MTTTIKLPHHLQEMRDDMTADRAPSCLLYVWPNGRPTECPTLAVAQTAATRFAGDHPGSMVAVYELAGFAYQPIREPEFQTVDRSAAPTQDAEQIATDAEAIVESLGGPA